VFVICADVAFVINLSNQLAVYKNSLSRCEENNLIGTESGASENEWQKKVMMDRKMGDASKKERRVR